MDREECVASITTRLQTIGMDVTTDTLMNMPVTVANGSVLAPAITPGTGKALVAARILLTVSGNIGPSMALGGLGGISKLFLAIFVVPVEPVSIQRLEELSHVTYERSMNMSKGTHSRSVVCIPVVLANNVPDDVKAWARGKIQGHRKGITMPVIVDLEIGEFAYLPKAPVLRGPLFPAALEIIESCILIPPTRPLPLRPDQIPVMYEKGLDCPHCNMRYLYQLSSLDEKVACKNCKGEIPIPKPH